MRLVMYFQGELAIWVLMIPDKGLSWPQPRQAVGFDDTDKSGL